MAPSAFEFFNGFKRELGLGNVPLDGTGVTFRIALFQSAAGLSATGFSSIGSVTGTVAGVNSKVLTVNWSVRTTTSTFAWSFATVIWTLDGGASITGARYAVVYMQTASTLICWSALSTAEFNVADGNNYVIECNPVAFTLN